MNENPDLNPAVMSWIALGTGEEHEDIQDLANLVDRDISLLDFIHNLKPPPCVNKGCERPRSNFSDECFECRFEPFGSEWQREQEERW